ARWHDEPSPLKHIVARLGEPVVRAAVRQAMRILAEQFVLAETIEEAARRGATRAPYVHSYDMLGEAARTAADATRYMQLYSHAIRTVRAPDTLSIKLSALHPRFEEAKRSRVMSELLPCLKELAGLAAARGVGYTIDAEESERLELTLDLHAALADEFTPGLAVQAYQKRALPVCEWLVELGRKAKRRLPIRLVKGAYWDSEVKRAQQLGMADYPVGSFTDLLPYLVRRMLENGANTSFVHQIADPEVPLAALVADPLAALPEPYSSNERIPLPRNLYPDRLNSLGLDLSRRDVLDALHRKISTDWPLMPVAETR